MKKKKKEIERSGRLEIFIPLEGCGLAFAGLLYFS